MGARDQARRLPAASPTRGRRGSPVHRRGYDWTGRYPAIAGAAQKLRARSFTLDGAVAVCDPNGVAVFDALHRHGTVREAILQAFDLLEADGEDLRPLALSARKARLAATRSMGAHSATKERTARRRSAS
jgi:bifunctional non-homologous end joining protein LigD